MESRTGRATGAEIATAPAGFVVVVPPGERIHFLDWGTPVGDPAAAAPGVLLVHGLAGTAWSWSPVARALSATRTVLAMDLRGHGLSDAPTEGYDLATLSGDAVAVAEGGGAVGPDRRVVVAGHGFGAIVAAAAARGLGPRCAGLVLVDGGWESLTEATGMDADEFLRGLDEPPEVMRSMTAFLADRAAFDPPTWDADQEQAARATVVETAAGRLVSATRPHAIEASVRTMFAYDPQEVLAGVTSPVTAIVAAEDEAGGRRAALRRLMRRLAEAGGPPLEVVDLPLVGHNVMRYRPGEIVAAIEDLGRGAEPGTKSTVGNP